MSGRKIVNQNIEKLRDEILHLTQVQFALRLGMDEKKGRVTVNNWEQGLVQVKSDDLTKISKTFGISVDWLLGLAPTPTCYGDKLIAEKYTGLSPKALNIISSLKDNQPREFESLNRLLSDDDFYIFVLWEISEYFNTQICFDKANITEIISSLNEAFQNVEGTSALVLRPDEVASYHSQRAGHNLAYLLENRNPLQEFNLKFMKQVTKEIREEKK